MDERLDGVRCRLKLATESPWCGILSVEGTGFAHLCSHVVSPHCVQSQVMQSVDLLRTSWLVMLPTLENAHRE